MTVVNTVFSWYNPEMEIAFDKKIPTSRLPSLIRDRRVAMNKDFIPIAENIKHVYIDKISKSLRIIANNNNDDDLRNIADMLDMYQAMVFLRIKDFAPCQTCSYYQTILEQTMVEAIRDFDMVVERLKANGRHCNVSD